MMSRSDSGTNEKDIVPMRMSPICEDVPVPDDPISFRLREVQTTCQLSHASIQSNCQNKSCFWSTDVFSKESVALVSFI